MLTRHCLKKIKDICWCYNDKVISKLLQQQNFAIVRKDLDGTMTAFAECHRKFRGLQSCRQENFSEDTLTRLLSKDSFLPNVSDALFPALHYPTQQIFDLVEY